ncbi:MAG: SulP family inorganic anion transporter [Cyclobacteriaceae bacterium]|nr:SulP family inorganic anion transporter [Cyclobacteriaceae bacterium]
MKRYLPFLDWIHEVKGKSLQADIMAGLTGAVVVLPQGVAFAMIAGMPPIFGLYTAMVLPVIAALFGSSRHLISGPTTAISIVVFASISPLATPGTESFINFALILTLVAGLIQFTLGLVRLGTLVNFVSHTVVLGFTAGASILIATSQINNMFGIEKPSGVSFYESWAYLITNIGQTNTLALSVGLITLISAIILKRINKKLPHMLIAMILGSLVGYFFSTSQQIDVVGELPKGLPPFRMPVLSEGALRTIFPNAFAIALLGLIEAVAIARSIAVKSGQQLNPSQEFIGQGLSNIVGSFFSSYAGSGSFTRSGVNYESGAKTPIAAISAALFLILTLLFVAPLAAYLPISAMAGIIMLVAYNLIDIKHIKTILKASKRESTVLIITFIATLTLDLEYAIYIGVIFSLIFYLQRTSTPRFVDLAPDPSDSKRKFLNVQKFQLKECPQLKIIRIEGSIFFGAVSHVATELLQIREGDETHLLIIGNGINLIDTSGAELLVNEAKRWREKGGGLYISGLKLRARQSIEIGGFKDEIGEGHFFDDKELAVKTIYDLLDKEKCKSCQLRIFTECQRTD